MCWTREPTPGLPAIPLSITTLGKSFTRVCVRRRAVLFGTAQGALMPAAGKVTVELIALTVRQTLVFHPPVRSGPKEVR